MKPVVVAYEGALQVITLNRPQLRNAVNLAMARGIAEAIDELDRRSDVTVSIITGAGNTFCAGMDLRAFHEGQIPRIEGRGFGGITESPPRKPLIAAVEGYALAGGFEIALTADLIVAAQGARFGLPEARRGLVAAGGGLMRLARRLPYHRVMELAMTGDAMTAEEAHRLGLVNRLVPDGSALQEAKALAARIMESAPLAVAATKRIVQESREWPEDRMFELQRLIVTGVMASDDVKEGAAAFVEKRPPVWQGR